MRKSTFGLVGRHHWRNPTLCRARNGARQQGTPSRPKKKVLMLCTAINEDHRYFSSLMREGSLCDSESSLLQHSCKSAEAVTTSDSEIYIVADLPNGANLSLRLSQTP